MQKGRALSLIPIAFILILIVGFQTFAHADLVQTARVVLNKETRNISIAPYAYLTSDPNSQYHEALIFSRHNSNYRGLPITGKTVYLSPSKGGYWLVFSVTNKTKKEKWYLDFGKIVDGRITFLNEVRLYNHSNNTGGSLSVSESYFENIPAEKENMENMLAQKIPLTLRPFETDLISIYIDNSSLVPTVIVPEISETPLQSFGIPFLEGFSHLIQLPHWWISCLFMIFTGMVFFSVGIALINNFGNFFLFSLYYGFHAVLLLWFGGALIQNSVINTQSLMILFSAINITIALLGHDFLRVMWKNYISKILFLIIGLVSLGTFPFYTFFYTTGINGLFYIVITTYILLCLLLILVSFIKMRYDDEAAFYFLIAWCVSLTGFSVTHLALYDFLPQGFWTINAYWLSLVCQIPFFFLAMKMRVRELEFESRQYLLRKSRMAQSLVRLRHSKESADQARLLRVIERERELMADLREREIARTEDMRAARDQADRANKAKSAFLAVVSHEIRTPMTGILGMVRLLLETKLGKDQKDYALAIQKSGDAMMNLLNDILDFEKIESGNMDLESVAFDLTKLVEGIVTLMMGYAGEKSLTLKSDIDSNVPRVVEGDPTRLRQVLLNLVSNAIKFTEKGAVTIRVKLDGKEYNTDDEETVFTVLFSVEDTGIGISQEDQAKLFDPFRQADKTIVRKHGGTGLGLAICKRLVEAMGGVIRIKSHEGLGSTFLFHLEMKEGHLSKSDEIQLNDKDNKIEENMPEKIPSMNILVIEDNEMNRKVLQGFLSKDGHNVHMVDSGEEGVECIQNKTFDIAFVDIRLRGMDGIETLKAIKSFTDKSIANLPVVAITGNVMEEHMKEYKEAGFKDVLAKPVDIGQLRKVLQKAYVKEDKGVFFEQENNLDRNPKVKEMDRKDDNIKSSLDDEFDKFLMEDEDFDSFADSIEKSESYENKSKKNNDEFEAVNREVISNLFESLGREQCKELMRGFLNKSDEIIELLKTEKNMQEIYERAHELKGMAANFGFEGLSKISAQLEKQAQSGKIEGEGLISDLDKMNKRSKEDIKIFMD